MNELISELAQNVAVGQLSMEEARHKVIENNQSDYRDLETKRKDVISIFQQAYRLERSPEEGYYVYALTVTWTELFDSVHVIYAKTFQANFAVYTYRYDKALEIFLECQATFKKNNQIVEYIRVTNNIGNVYKRKGLLTEAEKTYNEATNIAEETGKIDDFIDGLNNLAMVYEKQGRWEEAEKTAFDVLGNCEVYGVAPKGKFAIAVLGNLAREKGNLQEALGHHLHALDLFEAKDGEYAKQLCNVAAAHVFLGEFDSAIRKYGEALPILEERKDFSSLAKQYTDIGIVFYYQGQYSQALKMYDQALALARRYNIKQELATVLGETAKIYDNSGEKARAVDLYEESLSISVANNFKITEFTFRQCLGSCFEDQNLIDKAQKQYERAKTISIDLRNTNRQALVQGDLARIMQRKGLDSEAKALLEETIAIASKEDRQNLCVYRSNLAEVKNKMDPSHDPSNEYLEILKIQRSSEEKDQEFQTLLKLARYYLHKKDFHQSLKYAEEGIQALEFLRGATQLGPANNKFAEDKMEIYEIQVDCLISLDQLEKAWAAIERTKARFLSDRMDKTNSSHRKNIPGSQWQEYIHSQEDLENKMLLQQMYWEGHTKAKPSNEEISKLQRKVDEQIKSFRELNPEFSEKIFPQDVSLSSLQKQMKPNQLLVDFFVSEKKTTAFLIGCEYFEVISLSLTEQDMVKIRRSWDVGITRTRIVEAHAFYKQQIEANNNKIKNTTSSFQQQYYEEKAKDLEQSFIKTFLKGFAKEKRIQDFQKEKSLPEGSLSVLAKDAKKDWQKTLFKTMQSLSQFLQPLIDKLATLENFHDIIFVPHRELQIFPLNILFAGSRYLQDVKNIFHTPSAKIYLQTLSRPPLKESGNFLGVATNRNNSSLSPLTFIYSEVESAKKSFEDHGIPTKTLIDSEATRVETMRNIDRCRYLLLSCHGSFTGNFFQSGLHLYKDNITLKDVFNTSLDHVELAILSACETATSEGLRSSDYISIASCFSCAGCRNVVASLWVVDDLAMYLLISKLVEEFVKTKNVHQSLRLAQKWLRSLSGKDTINLVSKDSKLTLEENIQNLVSGDSSAIGKDKATGIANRLRDEESSAIFSSPHFWAGIVIF